MNKIKILLDVVLCRLPTRLQSRDTDCSLGVYPYVRSTAFTADSVVPCKTKDILNGNKQDRQCTYVRGRIFGQKRLLNV